MKSHRGWPDVSLLLTALAILTLGLIMVYSASSVEAAESYGDAAFFFKRQLVWAVLGLGALWIGYRADYWLWRRYSGTILLITLLLLVLVLVPGVGKVVNGSRRWIGFGILSVQPSEIAKLGMVIFYAAFLTGGRDRLKHLGRGLLPYLTLLGLVSGLIMLEPDLGTTAALGGTAMILLFCAGLDLSYFAGMGALAAVAGWVAIFGEDYRRRRFLAFLNPWADPLGSGYHIIQGLYAIGSGGLLGVGLGQSKQKLWYLPEQHTDFIFAIVGEELGFLGGALLLALFAVLIWRGYRIALRAPDPFAALLAVGITSMIAIQVLVNVGVVTSILPITGITLPLVSFGGSSLVFTLAGLGILLNVSRYCKG